MKGLSQISIERPVFAWMLMAGLIIFGTLSFRQLGVSQMPDVDFPVVNINASWQGAAPGVMESQVVDPIEDAVMEIGGIRSVNSTSRQSSANISVEFDIDRNIDVAVQEIQTRIAQVQSVLPVDMDPPTIRKSNPEDQPILWMTLTSDGTWPLYKQMMYARNVLYDQFSTIDGVGDIALGGYVDPNLRVWVSQKKLDQYELTEADVQKAIQNDQAEIPGGRIENEEREYNVRLMGEATSPEQFGKILINQRGGGRNFRPTQLSQVARIEEGLADVRRISRFNGKPTIGLGILKQHGSNAVEVANNVRERVKEIEKSLPKGLHLEVRMDTTKFIRDSVNELIFTLLLSALLTSIVCFLFLGSWSSTLNVLMAIPTSIVGTFIALHFFGFTLNTFTLLGLSLAIGIVVDDAIMMLENIVRHRELGKPKRLAALVGSQEITFAALAATIAVVAIFLPVVFMKGVIGRYFYQFGITVTVAVLLSLLEALTLTPMRCSRFLRAGELARGRLAKFMDGLFEKLAHYYARILAVILNHRWKTVLVTTLVFALSLSLIKFIPGEMIPAQDQGSFLLRLKAPVGSSLEFTNGKFLQVEDYLSKVPEVTGSYCAVGGFGGDAVNEGIIFVSLVDRSKRKLSQAQLMEKIKKDLQKQVHGIRVLAQDMSMRGFSSSRGFPVEFTVQGPDWDTLADLTQKMMDRLEKTGVLTDVNTDYQVGMPEIQLIPDREKSASRGVDLKTVSQTVNALVGGAVMGANTQYPKDGHKYDIRIRLEADERDKAGDLSTIKVRNNRGELVSLSEIVRVQQKPTLQLISRRNRERAITVYANLIKGHSQQEGLKLVEKIQHEVLPPGYHIVLTGTSQSYRESIQGLIIALLLGILVSYMVLASQFNSFLHPITVLMALPFSVSGAFVALFLTHQSINMFSFIGLILLMGIVKKNSILLVDFTNQLRQEGRNLKDALLTACPIRLRPILMTSVATIAGALPIALAIGPGSETRVPMAVAIIGGVSASTLLSLLVVPCVYSVLSRFEREPSLLPALQNSTERVS